MPNETVPTDTGTRGPVDSAAWSMFLIDDCSIDERRDGDREHLAEHRANGAGLSAAPRMRPPPDGGSCGCRALERVAEVATVARRRSRALLLGDERRPPTP